MKKTYQMPLTETGKPDFMKLGHDIRSVLAAIDTAYFGLFENPKNRDAHAKAYALAKERGEAIVAALERLTL